MKTAHLHLRPDGDHCLLILENGNVPAVCPQCDAILHTCCGVRGTKVLIKE